MTSPKYKSYLFTVPYHYTEEIMFTVLGSILFDEPTFTDFGVSVYLRILDVSIADAPSKVVAEKILPNVILNKVNSYPLPFSIQCPSLDPRGIYSLEVHVDMDGDGNVTKGDFITMESYPIITPNSNFRVNVKVRQVK